MSVVEDPVQAANLNGHHELRVSEWHPATLLRVLAVGRLHGWTLGVRVYG